jgi:hypothetical protein
MGVDLGMFEPVGEVTIYHVQSVIIYFSSLIAIKSEDKVNASVDRSTGGTRQGRQSLNRGHSSITDYKMVPGLGPTSAQPRVPPQCVFALESDHGEIIYFAGLLVIYILSKSLLSVYLRELSDSTIYTFHDHNTMNGKKINPIKSSCSSCRTPLPEIKKSALLYF